MPGSVALALQELSPHTAAGADTVGSPSKLSLLRASAHIRVQRQIACQSLVDGMRELRHGSYVSEGHAETVQRQHDAITIRGLGQLQAFHVPLGEVCQDGILSLHLSAHLHSLANRRVRLLQRVGGVRVFERGLVHQYSRVQARSPQTLARAGIARVHQAPFVTVL
eukprot:scaffold3289_cov362-Prasinococcus_capsulatus_cf.AAC.3